MDSKILVLCYHKVDDLPRDWNNITVSKKQFRKQMEYLKDNYNIVRGDADWESLKGNNIVITFDDGYEDFYLNAWPILEELEIPATVFISTGTIGTDDELWCNKLVWLVLEGTEYPNYFKYEKNNYKLHFNTRNILYRLDMYKYLKVFLNTVPVAIKKDIMRSIEEWGNAKGRDKRITHRMLSKENIAEISRSKFITIGGHTTNHPSLGYLSNAEQKCEIEDNKFFLENISKKEIDLFSYPYGGEDSYNADTLNIIAELGFKRAMTTKRECVTSDNSSYEIPRVSISECDIDDFAFLVDNIWKNERIKASVHDDIYQFAFIGKLEDDKELFKKNAKIAIWGSGKRGQAIYKRLKDINLEKRIICFFDSDVSKVNSNYEGILIKDINEYRYDSNMIVIIALKDILTITQKVEELKIGNKHLFV